MKFSFSFEDHVLVHCIYVQLAYDIQLIVFLIGLAKVKFKSLKIETGSKRYGPQLKPKDLSYIWIRVQIWCLTPICTKACIVNQFKFYRLGSWFGDLDFLMLPCDKFVDLIPWSMLYFWNWYWFVRKGRIGSSFVNGPKRPAHISVGTFKIWALEFDPT